MVIVMTSIDDLFFLLEKIPRVKVDRGRDYLGSGDDFWRKSFINIDGVYLRRITFLNGSIYYVKKYEVKRDFESVNAKIDSAIDAWNLRIKNEEGQDKSLLERFAKFIKEKGYGYGIDLIDDSLYIYISDNVSIIINRDNELHIYWVSSATKESSIQELIDDFYSSSENQEVKIENHQEEKVMDSHVIVNSLYKDLNVVQVVFESGPTQKLYDYKTFLNLEIDDKCIVDVDGTLKVVKVVGHDTRSLEKRKLKWIVQKIDMTEYERLLLQEEHAEKKVHEMIMEKRRRENMEQLEEFFGGAEKLNKISNEINKGIEDGN